MQLGYSLVIFLSFFWLQVSFALEPVLERVNSRSSQSLELAIKRYVNPGATPLLLLPGVSSNDRVWDAKISKYSFAQQLHAHGFDVWIANYRHMGTPGFKSESPPRPYHWTIEDYAIEDLPAIVDAVTRRTGQVPFLLGHSLSAIVFEGYFAGITRNSDGKIIRDILLSEFRQKKHPGVITVAGVYGLWWSKSIKNFISNPVLSRDDFYQSNYELELLSRIGPLYPIVHSMDSLPLGWIGRVLSFSFDKIPFIGSKIGGYYQNFQEGILNTSLLNMLYYHPNSDPTMVRDHCLDGLEEMGPRLVEQLANAMVHRKTMSHYHARKPPEDVYYYETIRESFNVPLMVVAGTKDRLAHHQMIYQDGYLKTNSPDKQWIEIEAGHLDILTGKNNQEELIEPLVDWIELRD